jgi:hypothetical protein
MKKKLFGGAFLAMSLAGATYGGCSGDIGDTGTSAGGAGTGTTGPGGPGSGAGTGTGGQPPPPPMPVDGHPRLWLTAKDLPKYQSWATASNPVYANGLLPMAMDFKSLVDSGALPSDTCHSNFRYCEAAMETFAFMSLLSSDQGARDQWAGLAHTLLMHMIADAKLGSDPNGNGVRKEDYSISDRSRAQGRSWGLTVDWIYPYLSAQDKADIREVFLRWADENVHADKTSANHPEPIGVFNDPQLVAKEGYTKWSLNNYYSAHTRNLGLWAMCLDPADDPGNTLHNYLDNSTGAFLYVTDYLTRHAAQGGLAPEGFEYAVVTLEYNLELLLALHTAGLDDPAKRGDQVAIYKNPYWAAVLPAYLHAVGPGPVPLGNGVPVYNDFASYGDLEVYKPYDPTINDFAAVLGPLGLYYGAIGDQARADAHRWTMLNIAPGGPDLVAARASEANSHWGSLFYFMMMDPNAAAAADPRPAWPTDFWVEGMRFLFARTGWTKDDTYFVWQMPWNHIDHQHADANTFGLFRKGEWMTTERPGYDQHFLYSPSHNSMAIQNDPPTVSSSLNNEAYNEGSGWLYGSKGDGTVVGHSVGADYAYATGDATDLYNTDVYGAADVAHASRSIVWLKPDHVVLYDRATSKTAGRFKRFYLHLHEDPAINGNVASANNKSGQKTFVTSLLPQGATLSNDPMPAGDMAAAGAEMHGRLRVEPKNVGLDERFLHVVQGADAGASADAATLIQSSAGTAFAGTAVKGYTVMFPVDLAAAFATTTFTAPAGKYIVTGLTPNAQYDVTVTPNGNGADITVAPGTTKTADAGGVLEF